jgi:hypothetical protein
MPCGIRTTTPYGKCHIRSRYDFYKRRRVYLDRGGMYKEMRQDLVVPEDKGF